METNIWVRHTHPTKFEVAPYGTIWKEMGENETHKFFIQIGEDQSVNWVRLGDFFEAMFEHLVEEKEFIEGCLYLHKAKGTREEKELTESLGIKLERIGERK